MNLLRILLLCSINIGSAKKSFEKSAKNHKSLVKNELEQSKSIENLDFKTDVVQHYAACFSNGLTSTIHFLTRPTKYFKKWLKYMRKRLNDLTTDPLDFFEDHATDYVKDNIDGAVGWFTDIFHDPFDFIFDRIFDFMIFKIILKAYKKYIRRHV